MDKFNDIPVETQMKSGNYKLTSIWLANLFKLLAAHVCRRSGFDPRRPERTSSTLASIPLA